MDHTATRGAAFEKLNEAIYFARANHLAGVEIVLTFQDPHHNIHFPLQDWLN